MGGEYICTGERRGRDGVGSTHRVDVEPRVRISVHLSIERHVSAPNGRPMDLEALRIVGVRRRIHVTLCGPALWRRIFPAVIPDVVPAQLRSQVLILNPLRKKPSAVRSGDVCIFAALKYLHGVLLLLPAPLWQTSRWQSPAASRRLQSCKGPSCQRASALDDACIQSRTSAWSLSLPPTSSSSSSSSMYRVH